MFVLLFVLIGVYYVYIKLSTGICKSATCLVGKTALITGANSGIGLEAALNLASRGCRVILADVVDLLETKNFIIKETNNPNIVTKHLDLESLKSVRDFAENLKQNEDKLDILINNAGIGLSGKNRTKDGLHPVMQINYFGHFLLTHLLIDLLKKAAPSRIIFTSSCMAFLNNLDTENLNYDDKDGSTFGRLPSYSNSKFALLVASDIFAKKLKKISVTSNSFHPGFVYSPLWKKAYIHSNYYFNLFMRLYNLIFSKTVWEGSQTLVHLAVAKDLEQVTGKYFWDCKPFFKPPKANNADFCMFLWKKSEKLVGLTEAEKLQ